MISRHRRNQRTLDRIKHDGVKLQTELSRIQKDINDNVLKDHKHPDGLTYDHEKLVVTTDQLIEIDKTYTKMGERLEDMKMNGQWNKTSV